MSFTPNLSNITQPSSATLDVPANVQLPQAGTLTGGVALTSAAATAIIDDLRNNDIHTRINSFNKIVPIAQVLGPKRTREELIPYLHEFCDDEDEILLLLAGTLGDMIVDVGGVEFAPVLLPTLELLAGTEEASVRDKSVASISKIAAAMSDVNLNTYIFPLLKRMAGAEWFTSRSSSCGLFPIVYPRVNDTAKRELRTLFVALCKTDELPAVKRAATTYLGPFSLVMDSKTVFDEMYPLLQKLSKDDQDSVRLLTIQAAIHIAKIFDASSANKSLNITNMTKILKSLTTDPAWRVRYMVADKFCELATALGPMVAQSDSLLDDFIALLGDNEAEVRTAAASRLGDIAKLIGSTASGKLQIIKKLFHPTMTGKQPTLSIIQQIVQDTDEATAFTRAALASVIMSISSILSPKEAQDHLLPVVLTLLNDKNSEVRLNLISKLESVHDVLRLDSVSDPILHAINDDEFGLAKNPKWRIRLQVIELIPILAKQMGEKFFNEKLSEMCMQWLGDSVWSIREAATNNLTKLAEGFGVEWAKQHIIPKVVNLGVHKSYLYRMTAVFAIKDLSKIVGSELTTSQLLPVVIQLTKDAVPNVRFNSARVLGALVSSKAIKFTPLIEQTLVGMMQDSDADVKYYAEQSITELKKGDASSSSI